MYDVSAKELYNNTASNWVRQKPLSLSDFIARPSVLKLCEPIKGLRVLDLGCGEGYFSRLLYQYGAKEIYGIDISQSMIEAAKHQEINKPLGITYAVDSATNLSRFKNDEMDLITAVFLFNYLNIAQTQKCIAEVARILRPGGKFVFSVPHPAFPYMQPPEPPLCFEIEGTGYFSNCDKLFPGQIWKRDGSSLKIQLVHKTFQDYFEALQKAGFSTMPTLLELGVKSEHLELDEPFFKPLIDIPIHLTMRVTL